MTFILSVIGFIGSLGFYVGVLRKVYLGEDNNQQKCLEQQIKVQAAEIKHLKAIIDENKEE